MPSPSRQRGISLIEVLVAVLILSLGLLGVAAMQNKSLSMNHSAYLRSQANIMAYDILDRMRANRSAAMNGAYDHQPEAAVPAGGNIAAEDLRGWLSDLAATLPEGTAEITSSNENRVSVTVQWRDRDGETQAFVTVTEL